MTAAGVDNALLEDKDLWQYFQKSLRRKCSKVIFITIKIAAQVI